jgi:hypothetical protein
LRKNLHFTEREAEKTLLEGKIFYRFPSESAKVDGRARRLLELFKQRREGRWDSIGMMMMHKKCFLVSFDWLGSLLSVMQSSWREMESESEGKQLLFAEYCYYRFHPPPQSFFILLKTS